jgi:hypothetical protein
MTKPLLPVVPPEMPPLDGPGVLARAAPAERVPFSLSGRRATAWGTELRGVEQIRAGRWGLLTTPDVGLGPASNVIVGPSSIRREVASMRGSTVETLLIPLDLPSAVLQWRRPAGSSADLSVSLAWWISFEGARALSHDVSEDGVHVAAAVEHAIPGGDGPRALVLLHPRPTHLDVRADGSALRIFAAVEAPRGRAITLLLAGAESEAHARSALRATTFLRAQEARAEEAAREARQHTLTIGTGHAEVDESLEWAKARLRGSVEESAGGPRLRRGGGACPDRGRPEPSDALDESSPLARVVEPAWVALGALASGDPEPARILLAEGLSTDYHAVVAARCAAWTGDGRGLFPHRTASERLAERSALPHAPTVLRIAARELADAWEAMGDPDVARMLRASVATGLMRHQLPARRLPMVGSHAPDESMESWQTSMVESVFGAEADPYRDPADVPRGGVANGLRAWALCGNGDVEAGSRLLREHLASGVRRGAGMWREGAGDEGQCADHAASAALGPAALLFGLFGARADAPLGRIRLAPRIPAGWTSLSVGGIRVGDAHVQLSYALDGAAHTFRVLQDRGRVPLMLIFEPEVAEPELPELLVDGAPAELDRLARGGRSAVRVQLPLDRERSITLIGRQGAT